MKGNLYNGIIKKFHRSGRIGGGGGRMVVKWYGGNVVGSTMKEKHEPFSVLSLYIYMFGSTGVSLYT